MLSKVKGAINFFSWFWDTVSIKAVRSSWAKIGAAITAPFLFYTFISTSITYLPSAWGIEMPTVGDVIMNFPWWAWSIVILVIIVFASIEYLGKEIKIINDEGLRYLDHRVHSLERYFFIEMKLSDLVKIREKINAYWNEVEVIAKDNSLAIDSNSDGYRSWADMPNRLNCMISQAKDICVNELSVKFDEPPGYDQLASVSDEYKITSEMKRIEYRKMSNSYNAAKYALTVCIESLTNEKKMLCNNIKGQGKLNNPKG